MTPSLNVKGKILSFETPKIMGILNATPDSFYTKGKYNSVDGILSTAEKMLEEGADILDIGGQSSRPGATIIGVEEELQRVIPAVEAVLKRFPEAIISIDTFRAEVAKKSYETGAQIINDISSGTIDPKMLQTISEIDVSYILMHMQGDPKNMQENPEYQNVSIEVFDYLNKKVQDCKQLGINNLVIDLGFGFGKTMTQNYELLKNLNCFKMLDLPILVGISRKSMIYKPLKTEAEYALNGTTALHTLAIQNGAHILRVHDVKECKEVIKLCNVYNTA